MIDTNLSIINHHLKAFYLNLICRQCLINLFYMNRLSLTSFIPQKKRHEENEYRRTKSFILHYILYTQETIRHKCWKWYYYIFWLKYRIRKIIIPLVLLFELLRYNILYEAWKRGMYRRNKTKVDILSLYTSRRLYI